MLGQVYQTKDSWLVIVLHKTSWGKIVTSFPSILYFVADMLFKTKGRICFLNEKTMLVLKILSLERFQILKILDTYSLH